MNYNERIHSTIFYNNPLEERDTLIKQFDKYHYQDKIINNQLIYMIYNKQPNRFKDFKSNYGMFNDYIYNFFTKKNNFDFRVLLKEFKGDKLIVSILTPYKRANSELTLKFKFDIIYDSNRDKNIFNYAASFFGQIMKLKIHFKTNYFIKDQNYTIEFIDELDDALLKISERINVVVDEFHH